MKLKRSSDIRNPRFAIVTKGKDLYRVKWKGYSLEESTWEGKENLDCPDLINAFLKEQEGKKEDKSPTKRSAAVDVAKPTPKKSKRLSTPRSTTKKTPEVKKPVAKKTPEIKKPVEKKTKTPDTTKKPAKTPEKTKVAEKVHKSPEPKRVEDLELSSYTDGSLLPKSLLAKDNWDALVKQVVTINPSDTTDEMNVYVDWLDGKETYHPTEVANRKFPQKVLLLLT